MAQAAAAVIRAELTSATRAIEGRLLTAARTLASARANRIAAEARREGERWRSPRLLWPLFEKD